MKFMLQLHKLPKYLEWKRVKEWVLSKIKQTKPGRLMKLRYCHLTHVAEPILAPKIYIW